MAEIAKHTPEIQCRVLPLPRRLQCAVKRATLEPPMDE